MTLKDGTPVDTGVRYCIVLPGQDESTWGHVYIMSGDRSWGFWPGTSSVFSKDPTFLPNLVVAAFASKGEIRSPDTYHGKGNCVPILVNACKYNPRYYAKALEIYLDDLYNKQDTLYIALFNDCKEIAKKALNEAGMISRGQGKCIYKKTAYLGFAYYFP